MGHTQPLASRHIWPASPIIPGPSGTLVWSIRFCCLLCPSFPCPQKVTYSEPPPPTRQGTASTIPSQARAGFVRGRLPCRGVVVQNGAWAIRPSEQWLRASVSCRGGARGPACRAPGSIGGVLGLVAIAPPFLIPGQGSSTSMYVSSR